MTDLAECTHGDDCELCCADCFRLLESHCENCGQCDCTDNECEEEEEVEEDD